MKRGFLFVIFVLLIGIGFVSAQETVCSDYNYTTCPDDCEKVCVPTDTSDCDGENSCMVKTVEPVCHGIPISMWCPDETTLCPMTLDEHGCSVWDCDACEPIEERTVCCAVRPIVAEPQPTTYEWMLETKCDPTLVGVSYQIVDDSYCEECEEGETKHYVCWDGTEVPGAICEDGEWVPVISPESACPEEEEPETCAAQIEINFDKTSYVVGDQFEIKIGVFDSQGNPIPNYPFYIEMYDDRWHTPGLERTGSDGYFKHTGIAEKVPSGITKVKFRVYTKELDSCGVVEGTTQLEIRQAPEPCGIGECVPEPECKDKIRMCGGDCPPCPDDGGVFYPCPGCDVDGKCYPMGYRKEGNYCSEDYKFVNQTEEGKCDNNFECKSNVCVSGECVGEGLIRKIIIWFKKMFGGGGEEPGPGICSKLLIEKDIGDNEYIESGYGENEHAQVPVYSENGENIGTIKCCMAEYSTSMLMICTFDSKEDLRNSLKWILAGERGTEDFTEYKGEKVLANGMIAWTNKAYLIVSGGKPEANNRFVEDVVDKYFEKYPSDFDLTEDDIPYIEPKPFVFCTEEDEIAAKECMDRGGYMQSDPSPDGECEVYTGCSTTAEEDYDPKKEFLIKAELVGELTLIDFEARADGTSLQNGNRLTGNEWESLGVVFETPSEEYLKVFGPMYPFNPLDELSLSPGFGPFESGSDTDDDLNIIFSQPVKAAGIYLLDLGETDERESITFLDVNGNVIEKVSPWPKSTFGNPAPGTFVGLIHEEGISKIEILENTQDGDDIAYDNLYFVR